jgi:hypothetical protein
MNGDQLTRDQTDSANDHRRDFDRASRVFADKISDAALEAAVLGSTITFTSSIVLLACRFC